MAWWDQLWRSTHRRPESQSGKPQTASKPTRPIVGEPKPRHIHLGIDFGTCWSKIVLRDYEANTQRAFVVRVPRRGETERQYRIPSAVNLSGGTLYFGWSGDARATGNRSVAFRSIKMRAAFPNAPEHSRLPKLPDGFTATELASLVVAYLIQVGGEAATQYVGGLPKGPMKPRIGMTIGVPMSLGQDTGLRDRFVGIARTALDLHHNGAPSFDQGLDLSRARDLLDGSRRRLETKAPVQDPREWVRSEAESGLLWIFESPRVASGLYICVDVGAGTTDVSVFRIADQFEEDTWIKGKLAFYSAVSDRPGVDALDDAIVLGLGDQTTDVRTIENDLIRQHGLSDSVKSVIQQIFAVYRKGWSSAYQKLPLQKEWHPFGLFVLGGGSKIDSVRTALQKSPWPPQLADRLCKQNEFPIDLFEMPRKAGELALAPFAGDGAFLLVAYGLSFMRGDVPPVETPDEMPAYEPPRAPKRSIDQDEYYPK